MAPTSPAADQLLSGSQITSSAIPKKRARSVDENSVGAGSSGEDETALSMYQYKDEIKERLEYKEVFQAKTVSKFFKERMEGDGSDACRRNLRPREGLLTALHFSVRDDGVWQCAGYDLDAKAWMKLPPFVMLPGLDSKLLKDRIICGAGGFMCVYHSAINQAITSSVPAFLEKMVVFHPLTGWWRELPPLNHPRNPVLLHVVVSPTGDSFQLIVAGSARVVGDEHLSKITEVFDSRTSKWTVTEEFPGPLFALNEFQNGAYRDGVLYCIGFLDGDRGRGLLAYSVEEGKWLPHLACPLPTSATSQIFNISQVANINGEVVVFSEIEHSPYLNANMTVERRIDVLEYEMHTDAGLGKLARWRNVLMERKFGSEAGLRVYPEYTCVPFEEGKMCIFNTITRTGDIYDMQIGKCTGKLSSPAWSGPSARESNFYTCNPVTFSFEPSFKSNLKLEHSSAQRVSLA